jgi:hypothetical protein
VKLRAPRPASGRLDGRLDRLAEVARPLAGGAQRQRGDQLARAVPLENVVDSDPRAAALPSEVVATLGRGDEVLDSSAQRIRVGGSNAMSLNSRLVFMPASLTVLA